MFGCVTLVIITLGLHHARKTVSNNKLSHFYNHLYTFFATILRDRISGREERDATIFQCSVSVITRGGKEEIIFNDSAGGHIDKRVHCSDLCHYKKTYPSGYPTFDTG